MYIPTYIQAIWTVEFATDMTIIWATGFLLLF